MDAALLWQLAIMFCQAHNLPPSTAFLVDCALADNWLMFLTFAQLHQYDKQLVNFTTDYQGPHFEQLRPSLSLNLGLQAGFLLFSLTSQ